MKKYIVLKLNEEQTGELCKLYERNINYIPGKKYTSGVILGHPDMNSMRIKFTAFKYWEYCILWVAFSIVAILNGRIKELWWRKNTDPDGMYSLWDEPANS